ncbi:MAG TPA: DUF1259 domain-containing protein [Bryobacteraceae bacterium]|nr:DUF1259 domain-containing protein [Bryobacteraceae bacterium]
MRDSLHHLALFFALTSILSAKLTDQQRLTIDGALSVKGTYTADEDTHRAAFPRTDLKVTIEGRQASPFLGFASWAAFTSGQKGVMVMGDMVLLEDEVSPAMTAALDNGLEVTALHNHFFYEKPRVMYMHISGHGEPGKLAAAVRKVLDAVKQVRSSAPEASSQFPGGAVPAENAITPAPLDAIFDVKGETNNGMYKATIGRSAQHHGSSIGKLMGVNTWAAFAGTDDMASVDGDFAMVADELQGVLRSLRQSGIHIVAIHNHMTHEQPQYVFLHYWGKGKAAELAKAVRAAMETQKKGGR